MKNRRKRSIPGDEAEMIEQPLLEVEFILPVFSQKKFALYSIGESEAPRKRL